MNGHRWAHRRMISPAKIASLNACFLFTFSYFGCFFLLPFLIFCTRFSQSYGQRPIIYSERRHNAKMHNSLNFVLCCSIWTCTMHEPYGNMHTPSKFWRACNLLKSTWIIYLLVYAFVFCVRAPENTTRLCSGALRDFRPYFLMCFFSPLF